MSDETKVDPTTHAPQHAFTVGKAVVRGVPVPVAADGPELVAFVKSVLDNCGGNYTIAAAELKVSPATVWKLDNNRQKDSPVLRGVWGIQSKYAEAPVCLKCGVVHVRATCPTLPRRSRPRPRVTIHTTNMHNAAKSIVKHIEPDKVRELIQELYRLRI